MPDKTETLHQSTDKAGKSGTTPKPTETVTRAATHATAQVGNIDELLAYMSAIRSGDKYNTNYPFLVTHDKIKVLDLEKFMPAPQRIRKDITFTETASFLAYFKEFRVGFKPQLFASRNAHAGYTIRAVLDYDEAGKQNVDKDGVVQDGVIAREPSWCTHLATLELDWHPDYAVLRQNSCNEFTQKQFAFFIEENTHVFHKPDAASMMEVAIHLKGHKTLTFEMGQRLANGQQSISYMEEIQGKSVKGEIIVPEVIEFKTPIYEGGDVYLLKAALRWNLDPNGKITFHYKLMTKLEERGAGEAIRKTVEDATGLNALLVDNFDGTAASPKKAQQ